MMKKDLKNTLDLFYFEKKAILSYNVQNLDQLFFLDQTSKELQIPVMAQFSAKYIPYFENVIGLQNLVNHYNSSLLYFHLDHCLDKNLIKMCVDAGFDSVMFDGSSLPLSENIKGSNEIYDYAFSRNCLLEVELGAISGVEDGLGTEYGDFFSFNELEVFHSEAKYNILALAIGNAHGVYESTENIQIDLLKKARDLIGETKFVLHGGTGMEVEKVVEAIEYGVVKINYSTGLKIASYNSITDYLEINKGSYDHLSFLNSLSSIKNYYKSHILNYSK